MRPQRAAGLLLSAVRTEDIDRRAQLSRIICSLKTSDFRYLDVVIDRLFVKLLKTSNMNTVGDCQQFF